MRSPAMKKPAPDSAPVWTVAPATETDWPGIWDIFHDVVATGDTYSYAPDTPYDLAMDVWVRNGAQGFVIKENGEVIGTYSLRRNHYGLGSHVANAGYMVHHDHRGQGIAKALCKHSLAEAKRQGCHAMQFNFVVSTTPAPSICGNRWDLRLLGFPPNHISI